MQDGPHQLAALAVRHPRGVKHPLPLPQQHHHDEDDGSVLSETRRQESRLEVPEYRKELRREDGPHLGTGAHCLTADAAASSCEMQRAGFRIPKNLTSGVKQFTKQTCPSAGHQTRTTPTSTQTNTTPLGRPWAKLPWHSAVCHFCRVRYIFTVILRCTGIKHTAERKSQK